MKAYRLSPDEILLIQNLIKIYTPQGFLINRLPEIYYTDYQIADSILSFKDEKEWLEREPSENFILNPDYLGVYYYDSNTEGIIILFRDRLIRAANRLNNSIKKSIYSHLLFDLLKAKVLIHEIGHWIHHSCLIVNKQESMICYAFLPKLIKESLAQLNVIWSFKDHKSQFEYFLEDFSRQFMPMQPYPYYEFPRIIMKNNPKSILIRLRGLISQPTHLNEKNIFDFLCCDDSNLTDIYKSIISGKSV